MLQGRGLGEGSLGRQAKTAVGQLCCPRRNNIRSGWILFQPGHICDVFSNSSCLVSLTMLEPTRGEQALQSRNDIATGLARSSERRARVAERTLCS